MYKTAAKAAVIANRILLHAYSLKAAALRLLAQTKKLSVTSLDNQASMYAPRFGTQSKQSSKQPY